MPNINQDGIHPILHQLPESQCTVERQIILGYEAGRREVGDDAISRVLEDMTSEESHGLRDLEESGLNNQGILGYWQCRCKLRGTDQIKREDNELKLVYLKTLQKFIGRIGECRGRLFELPPV